MKRNANTGLNIGSSSILIIFVLLCLTTFATLSMVSANADYRLTQRAALAAQQYYEADTRAEELLAEVNAALERLSSADPDAYRLRAASELPSSIEGLSAYEGAGNDDAFLTYSVPVNDTQELKITLLVLPAPDGGMYCKPTQWRVVNLSEYEGPIESDIEGLWGGDALPFPG